jgi:hypothetical protein
MLWRSLSERIMVAEVAGQIAGGLPCCPRPHIRAFFVLHAGDSSDCELVPDGPTLGNRGDTEAPSAA